jgi:hypothetical protein
MPQRRLEQPCASLKRRRGVEPRKESMQAVRMTVSVSRLLKTKTIGQEGPNRPGGRGAVKKKGVRKKLNGEPMRLFQGPRV